MVALTSILPRDNTAVIDIDSALSIWPLSGHVTNTNSAKGWVLGSMEVVKCSAAVMAGVDDVELPGLVILVCDRIMQSQHVQSSLTDSVWSVVVLAPRYGLRCVSLEGEASERGRDEEDALGLVGLGEQREEGVGGQGDTGDVGAEDSLPVLARLCLHMKAGDGAIVDQDVEPPKFVLDGLDGCLDAFVRVDVQNQGRGVDALFFQCLSGLLDGFGTSAGEDDVVVWVFCGELLCHLEADALVCSGDENNGCLGGDVCHDGGEKEVAVVDDDVYVSFVGSSVGGWVIDSDEREGGIASQYLYLSLDGARGDGLRYRHMQAACKKYRSWSRLRLTPMQHDMPSRKSVRSKDIYDVL